MEEKPIKIIIDYKNQRFTFTMPQDANLSIQSEISFNKEDNHSRFIKQKQAIMTDVTIEAFCGSGIEVKREDIT